MIKKSMLVFLVLVVGCEISKATIGIGTRFGTVVMEKVSPGMVYNLKKLRGVPYTVYNSGSSTIDVMVEVIPPENPKKGYEPIADTTWIRIEPDRFKLKPEEEFPCVIILSIPDDKTLIGKHYHAYLRVQTVGEGFYGAAVVNNFFFSIGAEGPEAVQKAKARNLLRTLNFNVDPQSIYLTVPAGRKVNIFKELAKSVKLLNMGRRNLKFRIKSAPNVMGYPVSEGFKWTPELSYIWAKPEIIKVKKNSIRDIRLFVQIPEEHKGKKFMFIIAVSPADEELSLVELYVRVFVTVK